MAIQTIKYFINAYKNRLTGRNPLTDDYDWKEYTSHYIDEFRTQEYSAKLTPQGFTMKKGILSTKEDLLPLHPNHRLLYETIINLKPTSVFEMGCGRGDHLFNLQLINPKIELFGCDLSPLQIKLLKKTYPKLKATIEVIDLSLPFSDNWPKVDIAFTQAVLMHMHTANNHLVALANLFRISTKAVVLMEHWTRHNFKSDIEMLYKKGMIPWKKIYFYYRRSPELGNIPHLMIISHQKLPFNELKSYSLLK